MTHLDLFSGIGGFALAAAANGIETIQFCEIDARCREFLSRAWPGVPIHDDIRTYHHDPARPVFLLTAGVPCQPASRAGKQRGAADVRWLWPEAIRVLGEVKPTWAIFENPPGIGDVGLAGVLSGVGAQGYSVRVFGIPACSVGAPHRRERYWIVANAQRPQNNKERNRSSEDEGKRKSDRACGCAMDCTEGGLANAERERREWWTSASRQAEGRESFSPVDGLLADWSDFVWLPCADGKVRRAPDDSFSLVDGLHRSLLAALGNSIVPQVAEKIIAAIVEAEQAGNGN